MNLLILIGRITKDPVLKKTTTGTSVTYFTIACDRRIKVEGQPTADFINCTAWSKLADNIEKYCKKGDQIALNGRIQTRSYEDEKGKKVFVTEVIAESVEFLEPKKQD